jgi:hypothetical protein
MANIMPYRIITLDPYHKRVLNEFTDEYDQNETSFSSDGKWMSVKSKLNDEIEKVGADMSIHILD